MAIRLVVTFKALPGKGGDFAQAFTGLAEITHKEKGCEQYQLLRALDDADTLVLLERWTTQEDLDVHLQAMQSRGGSPTTPFRAAGPPAVERYEVD
jgi:quinol monooxygenase YgiN